MDKSIITDNVDVDSETGCWNWNLSCSGSGYGQFWIDDKYWSAHRYSYLVFTGDLEEGKVVRHLCHNPKCCNPDHLRLGTHKDNYNDSRCVHLESSKRMRKVWIIGGVQYPTLRTASLATGISQPALIKYTIDGVFDIEAYRIGCSKAGHCPKI